MTDASDIPAVSPEESARFPEISGYTLTGLIGAGPQARVYRALQLNLDREVALKILSERFSGKPEWVERFVREARATARLTHENIISVHEVGFAGGLHFFSMEFVDGNSLEKLIDRGGALDEKRALSIVLQIARALDHAAEASMVHRDVKPSNILINIRSVAKLCDFGFARGVLAEAAGQDSGLTAGTPNYISPEQAQGFDAADPRSDVYSLGATLYHAVTGSPPFSGQSPAEVMAKHVTEDPVPPGEKVQGLSGACSYFIAKMMEKDIERRYHPINLVKDVENWLRGAFQIPAAAFSDSSLTLRALKRQHLSQGQRSRRPNH